MSTRRVRSLLTNSNKHDGTVTRVQLNLLNIAEALFINQNSLIPILKDLTYRLDLII
jgi:hypothetical protein